MLKLARKSALAGNYGLNLNKALVFVYYLLIVYITIFYLKPFYTKKSKLQSLSEFKGNL